MRENFLDVPEMVVYTNAIIEFKFIIPRFFREKYSGLLFVISIHLSISVRVKVSGYNIEGPMSYGVWCFSYTYMYYIVRNRWNKTTEKSFFGHLPLRELKL